ncbi:hypothetical protein M5K25_023615 [Dendrobium thyrsiflorum]|uniref:Uncharacterized protein n=1 Tax=Dendrobium thyrsiflorum TaxID=117978 RepID=A0ABD0UFX6_DENTH
MDSAEVKEEEGSSGTGEVAGPPRSGRLTRDSHRLVSSVVTLSLKPTASRVSLLSGRLTPAGRLNASRDYGVVVLTSGPTAQPHNLAGLLRLVPGLLPCSAA